VTLVITGDTAVLTNLVALYEALGGGGADDEVSRPQK